MLALGLAASAQESSKGGFEKQDWYVTGTAGYNSIEAEDTDISNYTFSPSAGYFITDHISLELGLIVGGSTSESFGGEISSTQFGGSLVGNYYFTPKNDFSFVIGAGLSYASGAIEFDGIDAGDMNTFALAVAPGINYFVSERLALRASVGALSYVNMDSDGSPSTSSFGLNLDLSNINFGITYKL
ncbi:outer membrane beta-barrel protein [Tenacibaculum tangerinum]|uniref:Outer membrane beta-barrel protein n=1 Tax=Tenacibaculum tangerinum TaxID=3038772 RepID=A0ABY8L359_9FLAO|nr:outer membrane beta-barrel protein [Tenacibaculum tangerinum]WGH75862.1 outer membrane beta-barrel protein [Tenacibaculum tangerinum]